MDCAEAGKAGNISYGQDSSSCRRKSPPKQSLDGAPLRVEKLGWGTRRQAPNENPAQANLRVGPSARCPVSIFLLLRMLIGSTILSFLAFGLGPVVELPTKEHLHMTTIYKITPSNPRIASLLADVTKGNI